MGCALRLLWSHAAVSPRQGLPERLHREGLPGIAHSSGPRAPAFPDHLITWSVPCRIRLSRSPQRTPQRASAVRPACDSDVRLPGRPRRGRPARMLRRATPLLADEARLARVKVS